MKCLNAMYDKILFYVAFILLPIKDMSIFKDRLTQFPGFLKESDHSSRYSKGHAEFHSVNSTFL